MKKPTLNQRIWQSLIKEAQKALTQITKHTGEIFDESVFTIQQPKRVTQKAISRLRETELKFIHTKTEEVIHNLQPKEAEELTRKIRTREQYIRHPRISTTTERERHPLTPEERSARAKKAWKTRWERMTPEEQTEYRETFKERMKKGKQAKELERLGFEPPEIQGEYGTDEELTGIIGEPPTPEEQEEYYKETVKETDIIDYSVQQRIKEEEESASFPRRIPQLEQVLNTALEKLGERNYYKLLSQNADIVIKNVHFWLNYKYEDIASGALYDLRELLGAEPMTLAEAFGYSSEYDTEMDFYE